MSRFLTSMLQRSTNHTIAISARGAAWVDAATDRRSRRQQLMWGDNENPTTAMQSLQEQLKLPTGADIAWITAPSLLRHWLQTPPSDTQSLSELHTVARARALQLFGSSLTTEISPVSTWAVTGDWHATQAFVCGAIPSSWQAVLQNQVKPRSQIFSPLQLVLQNFKGQLPVSGWLAIVLADALYLIYFEKKQIQHLRTLQLSPALVSADLQNLAVTEWRREMLRTSKLSDQLHYLNVTSQNQTDRMTPVGLKPVVWTSRRTVLEASIQHEAEQPVGLRELEQTLWCALQCRGYAHV